MSSTVQQSWIKRVELELFKLDEQPLLESSPFPLEQFSEHLGHVFEWQDLSITAGVPTWRTSEELYEGIGIELQKLAISFAPLEGTLHWLMSKKDLSLLFSWALNIQDQDVSTLPTDALEGFYQFIAIEALQALEKTGSIPSLAARLSEENAPPEEPSLCLDITLEHAATTLCGRLCLSQAFRRSWMQFCKKNPPQNFQSALSQRIEVTLNVEAGRTLLSLKEWEEVNLGDVILIENCAFNPLENNGPVLLTCDGLPIFQGMLNNNQISLSQPTHFEE